MDMKCVCIMLDMMHETAKFIEITPVKWSLRMPSFVWQNKINRKAARGAPIFSKYLVETFNVAAVHSKIMIETEEK